MFYSVILLFLLIIVNGFFAGSEIAFISINERMLELAEEKGDRKARSILRLKEKPNRFLSTIQIGVSIASILSGVFAAESFAAILTEQILSIFNLPVGAVKTFSMFFITITTSFLMLVGGELVPKRLALSNPQKFAYIAIRPLTALATITGPVVKLLSITTNWILRILGINPESIKEAVTEEEIKKMVDDGEISPIEKKMIENIFKFDDKRVTEIMTHRTDVVGIDSKSTLEDVLSLVSKERYTRYPVYDDSIDTIVGVLHLREILEYIQSEDQKEFDIYKLIKDPYFVPDSKPTDELFRELQLRQTHMGIVVDEYGGTAGIVTMENLVEEIMGEIKDEYDSKKDSGITKISNGEYLVDGTSDLDDVEEIIGIGLPVQKYDTVNGFVVGRLGKIPTSEDLLGNKLKVYFNGYLFSVVDIDGIVVSKVKVTKQNNI